MTAYYDLTYPHVSYGLRKQSVYENIQALKKAIQEIALIIFREPCRPEVANKNKWDVRMWI